MNWQKTLPGYFFNAIRHGYGLPAARRDLPEWRRLLEAGRTSVSEELPWVSMAAFRFFEEKLGPGSRVFEFGGGGSTLYFLKKVGPAGLVATVEHDAAWMEILKKEVARRGFQNWDGQLAEPEKPVAGRILDPRDPAGFASTDPNFRQFSFKNYAQAIRRYPDRHFDLVLVDGRARPSCIAESLEKVRPGGWLTVDNCERPHYLAPFGNVLAERFEVAVEGFGPTLFHPAWSKTMAFRRK